jgi:sigma-B regulation protein RsbU (phosphoserine phosphatase)
VPETRATGSRPRIWIVDDSPTEAQFTERSLGADYDFVKFDDGSEVVEQLTAGVQQPDVLLLDWVMPGMAGPDVCRFLRSHPSTQNLPIILVTASRVETGDIVQGLASGANDYVARPFVPEELRARVDAVLRAKQLRDAAAHERQRLKAINQLSRALLEIGASVGKILDQLAVTLTSTLCDGCSVMLLPGPFPPTSISRHRAADDGGLLAQISSITDPVIHAFTSTEHARRMLPPAYHTYLDRFGLRGLAILPFPTRDPIQGVVTVTRDGGGEPFQPDDIATLETCIEYAALAVETALRFDAERAARDQLRSVLEHLPIGIVATDADGALTLVNSTAARLVPGIEHAVDRSQAFSLAKWTSHDGTPIDEADWIVGAVPETLGPESSGAMRLDVLETAADGKARAVVMSGVPLRDGRGSVVGSVTAIEDVSAERAIADERERVAEFQQQMLGIVGHDLRNPLGAMVAGIALLDATIEDGPAAKVVRRLESSTLRMTRIVEQLLDMTRARLGRGIPIELREVQLMPIVKAAIDEMSLAYPKTQFELIDPDAAEIQGRWDPDRLAQVLSNLMGNAAQYGRKEEPVTIRVETTSAVVAITVTNAIRDKPIPQDQLAVLFDPYRRGRGSERHHTGLGLGLYIVHEIVKSHRGIIEVDSTIAGTSFRVMLPIRF